MNAANKYFGIVFPQDYNLSEEVSRKLAKLLFMSPSTSANEAKKIIANQKLTSVINLLIDNLSCELKSFHAKKSEQVRLTDEDSCFDDEDEDDNIGYDSIINTEKFINNKLVEWVKVFSPPSEDEIIEVCKELQVVGIDKWVKTLRKEKFAQLDTPAKIADYLSFFIVGQPDAIKTISVMVHDHKIRNSAPYELPKTSCLFIGDTGTGKSYLVNKAREILNVPMLRVNCGDIVPAGIVGYNITKALTDIHLLGNSDIGQTEKGILHFDEFDKLAKHNHDEDDGWKTTTQFELLKFFDQNEKIIFPNSFEHNAKSVQISTNNLMFIFSGAFQGIDTIIYSRLISEFDGNTKLIDADNLIQYCNVEDIKNYGIIPELAGRLSFISPLNKLNTSDIYNILTKAKESDLSKHIKKCELMGIHIRFTEDALRCIAEKVTAQNLGARYINTILTQILKDVYFNAQNYKGNEFIVDAKMVLHACNSKRYLMLYKAFKKTTDLNTIAEQFEINVDTLLDIYLEYKSLKNGGQ